MDSPFTVSFDLDGVIMQNPFASGVFPWVRNHVRSGVPALAQLEQAEADRQLTAAVNGVWMERMRQGSFVSAYDWDDILNEASRGLGGPEIPDVASLVQRFCGEDGMISLLPGAVEGLELLRANGADAVALTNGYRRYQQPVLEALGVDSYFSEVYTPEVLGFAKPQEGAFRAIPGLRAHVGDTLVHDVLGARLAGVTSVWLNPDLPDGLAELDPAARARAPLFREFLAAELGKNPYTRFHPEANPETAAPDLVARDVLEAAEAILRFHDQSVT